MSPVNISEKWKTRISRECATRSVRRDTHGLLNSTGALGDFSGKLEVVAESFGNLRDTLTGRRAHFTLRAAFAKYEPDSWAVHLFVVADSAGELSDFERAAGKLAIQNRARNREAGW